MGILKTIDQVSGNSYYFSSFATDSLDSIMCTAYKQLFIVHYFGHKLLCFFSSIRTLFSTWDNSLRLRSKLPPL